MTAPRRIPELSVTFPVLNEEDVLPSVLEEDLEVLPVIAERWELVVVDDGSTDRTPDILRQAAAENWRIALDHEPQTPIVRVKPDQERTGSYLLDPEAH